MGRCINHPDRETSYHCMKHDIFLCEECLQCRDPHIYCKYRPSCPIHFMTNKMFDAEKEERHPQRVPEEATCLVKFQPGDNEVNVPVGTNLLEAAEKADVYINASCNGKGACGKCKLIVDSGHVESLPTSLLSDREISAGVVLACQSTVMEDVTLTIPPETQEKKLKAEGMGLEATEKLIGLVDKIKPIVEVGMLQLDPPTLDDSISDLDRLRRTLKKQGCDISRLSTGLKVMRQLTRAVRKDNWKVRVSVLHKQCSSEIVNVSPADMAKKSLGLAVDLGTTSIVVYVVDMDDGKILSAASGHNRQASCGDDVINRIVCAEKTGVKKLQSMSLATINNLIKEAMDVLEYDHTCIENITVSGNTTMTHLLLGLEPDYIRREPYIPTVSKFPVMKAGVVGLRAARHAGVYVMPGPASYVGGDIVSGVLYTGFHKTAALTLFIDVGTNGEIVLGNNEFMMTAACSAGPAFEGGGIRWGMRAEDGAMEKIKLSRNTLSLEYETVGGKPARGICGSGMIDLMSEMLIKKVVGQDGRFMLTQDHPRMTNFKGEPAFLLASAQETGTEDDIIFTESDIKSLILSKAAVFAGFTVLLQEIGMDFSMVEKMIITGGFGQHLNIKKAITMGLLPDIDRDKFSYMGNSSIAGAYMALLSNSHRREAARISNSMTYLDFSSNSRFMDEFTRAQFLPHTDAGLFPSVERA